MLIQKKSEELEKFLEELEFKRTYPELAIKLCKEIKRNINNFLGLYWYLKEHIKRKTNEAKKMIIFLSDNIDVKNLPVAAVDSSYVQMKCFGHYYAVFLSAAYVFFKEGLKNIETPSISLSVKIDQLEQDGIPPTKKATLRMKYMEISAIQEVSEEMDRKVSRCRYAQIKGVIMLDGPIIDPPSVDDREYISKKIEAINIAYLKNVEIVGVIKRYHSRVLSKRLLNENTVTDRELIPMIFLEILKRSKKVQGSYIATIPFKVVPEDNILPSRVLEVYKEELKNWGIDKNIYCGYIYLAPNIKPLKIEFLAENDEEAKEKIKFYTILLTKWYIPGFTIPFPVALAHIACSLRKRVVRKLLIEIISSMTNLLDPEEIATLPYLITMGE